MEKNIKSTAIVLLSGGLDSTVTLYWAKQYYHCRCLIFNYGQRHYREVQSAIKVARKSCCHYKVIKFRLPWLGSSLLDQNSIPQNRTFEEMNQQIPTTYVPARNTIFISFGVSYAEAVSAEAVCIGANAIDFSGYPDCRPQYYRSWQYLIKQGTKCGVEGKPIKIITPLIHKTKSEIIRLGVKLKAPIHLTWSCYRGGTKPCGKCDACLLRAKGFQEINIPDPSFKGCR